MASTLTGYKIKDTYQQLLHVDGGVDTTSKTVYSGIGVATPLKLSSSYVTAGAIRMSGSTITTESGSLTISPAGAGQTIINNPVFTGTSAYTVSQVTAGNINVTNNAITSTNANGDVTLGPNGTGKINLTANTTVVGASGAVTMTTPASSSLTLNTAAGASSGYIAIASGANGDITLSPNGTGSVVIPKVDINGGAIDGVTIGTNAVATEIKVDNLRLDGNTLSSTDTNGNITLAPNGTGSVDIAKVAVTGGAIDGVLLGGTTPVTQATVDNLRLDGNTLSSMDTNGNITLAPNGTGAVVIPKATVTGGTLDGVLLGGTTPVTQATVDNLRLDGNTLSSTDTNGNITLAPNGTGSVDIAKAAITGGTIDGVLIGGTTPVTQATVDNLRLDGNTLSSTDTDGEVVIQPNGAGTTDIHRINPLSGALPFSLQTGRRVGQFLSTADQSTTANTPSAITFTDSSVLNVGTSVVSSSRLTVDRAGVYQVSVNIQFQNTDSTDRVAHVWIRKNGSDVDNSATGVGVPKATDGGHSFFTVDFIIDLGAGEYFEFVWAPSNALVTLYADAASASPFTRPAIPSVIALVEEVRTTV